MQAYLFVHFIGRERNENEEQIYFSVSADGRNWTTLNNKKPALKSGLGECGVRDPHIIRGENGRFYIMATDLSIYHRGGSWAGCTSGCMEKPGSKKMVVWESDNLTDWSEARLVQAAADNAGCWWAPECIWDKEKNAYMVYAASSVSDDDYAVLRVYSCYTKDFMNFTEPQIFTDSSCLTDSKGKPMNTLDTTIIKNTDGKYYRIYKTDRINIDSADSLSGEWAKVDSNIHDIASNVEGPTICRVNGSDKWCLLVDGLGDSGNNAKGYHPLITGDLAGGQFADSDEIILPSDIIFRHGTMMQITMDEYARLKEKIWREV